MMLMKSVKTILLHMDRNDSLKVCMGWCLIVNGNKRVPTSSWEIIWCVFVKAIIHIRCLKVISIVLFTLFPLHLAGFLFILKTYLPSGAGIQLNELYSIAASVNWGSLRLSGHLVGVAGLVAW